MPISLAWLDPRRSLASAVGWMLAALAVLGALASSAWVGSLAQARLEAQTGALYRQYAVQISNVLDNNLYDRVQWVQATAQMFAPLAAGSPREDREAFFTRMGKALPGIAWAGFADADGIVRNATTGVFEGTSVAASPWFVEGRKAAWIGDVHDAEPAGNASVETAGVATDRLLDLAAPVRDARGRVVGVVGVQLGWQWAQRLQGILSEGLKAERPIESLLLDRRGVVVLGPERMLGARLTLPGAAIAGETGQYIAHETDGTAHVVGYAVSDGVADFAGLGWIVVVRENTQSAFADVDAFTRHLFAILLTLGFAGAVTGIWITIRLTRGLARIARAADDIRTGSTTTFAVPDGRDEAARIGHSLRLLLDNLQRERERLQQLNAELDARVAIRTRQIERMSEETRYAAVVRERLRMARDLHDTLAHSIMAVLTEIRLLRRLADTQSPLLREEIANAELVAQQGLKEARDAIGWLRSNAVRDIGLGAAIRQLLARFEERSGVPVAFHCGPGVDALADAHAETLYRIVEEALRNIERHANADHVEVSAEIEAAVPGTGRDDGDRLLRVRVRDDGAGFDVGVPHPGHFGLPGMREQADLIEARLGIVSTVGEGTVVTVDLPL